MKERLNGMSVFAEVVGAKSFSAAADKLGISKSLASREVSALERSLAVKLLNRSTRKLSLTEAGSTLLRALREHPAGSGTCRAARDAGSVRAGRTREDDRDPGVRGAARVAGNRRIPAAVSKDPGQAVLQQSHGGLGRRGLRPRHPRSFAPAPNLVARKLAVNRLVLLPRPHISSGTARRVGSRTSKSTTACSFRCSRPKGSGRSGAAGGNTR